MTRVDCDDCSMNFQTKKLYIKHLKSKECSKSKHKIPQNPQPLAKKPRLEGQALQESLLKVGLPQQSTAQYSQKQMEVLQSQITQLSHKQKELLQAQITQKQRQVLQAIPYNQLSEKQKEILKRLSSSSKPTSTPSVSPTQSQPKPSVATPAQTQVKPNVTQASLTPSQSKDSRVEQAIKKGRRKNVYNKIPELKNSQIVKLPTSSVVPKTPEVPTEETETVIRDFVFSDEPIAADNFEIAGDPITMVAPTEFVTTETENAVESISVNPLEVTESILGTTETASKTGGKLGSLKIKSIANAFQEISNIIPPTATPKETCPHCKKIFSKAGISQHIEHKHRTNCDHCGKSFLRDDLENHVEEVHMAPCEICKEVVIKDTMTIHIDQLHKQKCLKCKVKFYKTEIADHVRAIHEAEGCNDCEARFENKDILGSHMNSVHLVEKCDECKFGFKTVEELETHIVEVHPKEYCDESKCEAVFGTVEQLKEHKEKVHPRVVSFNGGMFMMMMVQDDQEDEDETEDAPMEEIDNSEEIRLEMEEKAAVYKYLEQLVIDAADDVVKTAMTGMILFSVRFSEEDGDESDEETRDDNDSEEEEANTENSEVGNVQKESEDLHNNSDPENNSEDSFEEGSSTQDIDPLDDNTNDCSDNLMQE